MFVGCLTSQQHASISQGRREGGEIERGGGGAGGQIEKETETDSKKGGGEQRNEDRQTNR